MEDSVDFFLTYAAICGLIWALFKATQGVLRQDTNQLLVDWLRSVDVTLNTRRVTEKLPKIVDGFYNFEKRKYGLYWPGVFRVFLVTTVFCITLFALHLFVQLEVYELIEVTDYRLDQCIGTEKECHEFRKLFFLILPLAIGFGWFLPGYLINLFIDYLSVT